MPMHDWPRPYVDGDGKGQLGWPNLSRQQCIDLGNAVAKALIKDAPLMIANPSDPSIPPNPTAGLVHFAVGYLSLVKSSQRQAPSAYLEWYLPYIEFALQTMKDDKRPNAPAPPDISNFNEHDFANVHRAAWLSVLRALSRLVAFNPLSIPKGAGAGAPPNQWGDPLGTPSARSADIITKHGDFFFRVPLGVGYYALTNSDFNDSENSVLQLGDPPQAIDVTAALVDGVHAPSSVA